MKRANKDLYRQRLDRLADAIKAHMWARAGLDVFAPKTVMGQQALVLTETVASYAATLTAVSGYTAVVQSISPPAVQEQTTTTGPGVSPDVYDEYENQFLPLWSQFQAIANQWMAPGQPNSQGLYTQLSSVPNNIIAMNYTVSSDLNAMLYGQPGTSSYDTAQSNLEGAVTGQANALQGLIDQVNTYSDNLASATDSVVSSANSGALYQTMQEYESQIDDLNNQIDDTNDDLHDNEIDLLKEAGAATGLIVMGVVGIVGMKTKDPATQFLGGILTIAAGIGFATEIVNFVKTCIAISGDLSKLKVLDASVADDETTATALGVMINQIDGFAGLESAAIEALQEVLNAYQAMIDDLNEVANDASKDDPQDAQAEWNEILTASNNLVANLAYYWPGIYEVYECKSFAPTTSGLVTLASDGTVYQYSKSSGAWTQLPGQAVSVAATDDVLVRINAAPLAATSPVVANTYYASLFRDGAWQDISDFSVGNITAYGANIYAVRSSGAGFTPGVAPTTDISEVLMYSGSGTNWTSLGAPNSDDAPAFISACDGGVFATTIASGQCYFWDGSSWTEMGDSGTQYLSPVAAQSNLSMIDVNHNAYLGTTGSTSLSQTQTDISWTAVDAESDADQYVVTDSGVLNAVTGSSGNYHTTQLQTDSLSIFGDTTGANFYAVDLSGAVYQCSGSGASMMLTQLPTLPASSDT